MVSPAFYRLLSKIITTYYFLKVGTLILIYFVTHPFKKLTKERSTPPKCLNDPKYGEHKYARINGIKLHYVEKGDHSKPLIVFVHGFPEFWYSWRYQLEEFSKDYWCVAIDCRGYGDSEKPSDVSDYKLEYILNDIKELVISLGCKKFTIVGHDWGALIVWSFVDHFGDMVQNYITMSGPHPDVYAQLLFKEKWQFQHAWYVFFFQNPWLPEISMLMEDLKVFELIEMDAEDVEAFKYTYSKPGAFTSPVNYYRANFLSIEPSMHNNNRPKGLYILGEHDAYISQSTSELQKDCFDRLQCVTLNGAKHFIQQENFKEINTLIRDFVETH